MSNEFEDIKEFGNRSDRKHKSHMKYQHNNENETKLMRLWMALAVLSVILIIALIVTNSDSDKKKESKDDTKKETLEQMEENETKEDVQEEVTLVALPADNEIYSLVTSYIDAAYVKCDEAALGIVMDSMDNVNVGKNTVRQRYIENYNNINVYVLDGKQDINVVLVTYDVKLYNFDTLLPSGETLMIKKCEDGLYKIHNIEVGEKFESHMSNAKQVEEMVTIQEKIQSEYNAVIEGNSEIKSIVDILNGAKSQ